MFSYRKFMCGCDLGRFAPVTAIQNPCRLCLVLLQYGDQFSQPLQENCDMTNWRPTCARNGVLAIAAGLLLAGGGRANAQGQYREVTAEDVLASQLNHYFSADKKSHQPDFTWSFTKDEFILKAGAGAIPADLVKRLLPAGVKADEIRGKWKLISQDGRHLVLTDILATDSSGGEVLGNKEAKLIIYRTAPTVVRIGDPQYVFGIGP
jgi:hypothetical protein